MKIPKQPGGQGVAELAHPAWARVAARVARALAKRGPCAPTAALAAVRRSLGCSGIDARQALAASEDRGLATYRGGLWRAEARGAAAETFTPYDPRGHAASARLENP